MIQAFGQLLPIAVATAISSVPIMAMIMILLSPHRTTTALPFLIGWVAGIAGLVALCVLVAQTMPVSRVGRPDTALGIAEMVIGVAIIAVAVVSWRRRDRAAPTSRTETDSPDLPRWLRTVGSLGAWSTCGVALVLNLRPKGLLLAIAAGLVLRGASLSLSENVVVLAGYTAIAGSTILVPIVLTLAAPDRMEPRLILVKEWLKRYQSAVSTAILIMVGVVAIGNGMTHL